MSDEIPLHQRAARITAMVWTLQEPLSPTDRLDLESDLLEELEATTADIRRDQARRTTAPGRPRLPNGGCAVCLRSVCAGPGRRSPFGCGNEWMPRD